MLSAQTRGETIGYAPSHKSEYLDIANTTDRFWKLDNGIENILENVSEFTDSLR
jgi:hypothetical protein